MSDSDDLTQTPGLSSAVTGEITVAVVILVFVLFAVSLILYLRAKGYSGTIGMSRTGTRHPVFISAQPNLVKQALDPSILKSIPVTVFRAEDYKEEGGLECAVCLSEVKDGDKARLLPKCRHGFHVECIDMWFQSNSTCPLCRDPVQVSDEGTSSSAVLFYGKRQRAMLAIDIPRRGALLEGIASSPIRPADGIKSPALETLRNLGRILSKGGLNNNCVGPSCASPSSCDVEQGAHSAVIIQKSSESASYS